MLRHRGEQLAIVLDAFSDATRRIILEELATRQNQSLFEIMTRLVEKHQLSITRQAISKHLRVLEEAELIETAWSGRTKLHSSCIADGKLVVTNWFDAITPKDE